jgi:indolepyruvate ferredoxin oxidoreductase
MLGFTWQKGLLPLSLGAIEEAIRLNGVAVDANLDAFAWGRVMAQDAKRLPSLPAPGRALEDMTTEEVVAHRRAHLTAYQGPALARRYVALVEKVETAARGLSDRGIADRPTRSVATGYARLLAPKDEYEVARLLTAPEFRKGLNEAFEDGGRITLNLAPPVLGTKGSGGRPRKREFGPWALPVLRVLAQLRALRGTALDPFARTTERRAEREWLQIYEADVDRAIRRLDDHSAATALALLDLSNGIRGYGPVKAAAMEEASRRRARLLEELDRVPPPEGQRIAAE